MKFLFSVISALVLISAAMTAFSQELPPELPEVSYACRATACSAAEFDADILLVERHWPDGRYEWTREFEVKASPELRDIYACKGDGCFLPLLFTAWDGVSEYAVVELGELSPGETIEVLVVDYNDDKPENFLQLVNSEVITGVTVGPKVQKMAYTATDTTTLEVRCHDTILVLARVTSSTIAPTPTPIASQTPTNTPMQMPTNTPVIMITPVNTATQTPTPTATNVPAFTPPPLVTPATTVGPTSTQPATSIPTSTRPPAETPTATPTATATLGVPTDIKATAEPGLHWIMLPIVQGENEDG